MATQKQLNALASLISQYASSYPALKTIVDNTPKNNEKYPDTRANYQTLILADSLAPLTNYEASYLISYLLGRPNQYNKKLSAITAFRPLGKIFRHLIIN